MLKIFEKSKENLFLYFRIIGSVYYEVMTHELTWKIYADEVIAYMALNNI